MFRQSKRLVDGGYEGKMTLITRAHQHLLFVAKAQGVLAVRQNDEHKRRKQPGM